MSVPGSGRWESLADCPRLTVVSAARCEGARAAAFDSERQVVCVDYANGTGRSTLSLGH